MRDKSRGKMVNVEQRAFYSSYPFVNMKVGGEAYQEVLISKNPGAIRSAIYKTKAAVLKRYGEYWRFKTEVSVDWEGVKTITVWRTR